MSTRTKALLAVSCVALLADHASMQTPLTPPPVHNEALVFDETRGRLVLLGGSSSIDGGRTWSYTDETWEWDGRQWSIARTAGLGPGPRAGHALGHDVRNKRLVVYGGAKPGFLRHPSTRLCDTWFYTDQKWTPMRTTSCPSTRLGALLVNGVDSLLLLEGAGPVSEPREPLRIWRLDAEAWTLVDSAGPKREAGDPAAFDRARSVVVLPIYMGPDRGTWEWDGRTWTRHDLPTALERRASPALVYDHARQRILLFGGAIEDGTSRQYFGDVWAWDGKAWTELPTRGAAPAPRFYATLVSDPAGGNVLLFGGSTAARPTDSPRMLQELWQLDRAGTWTRVSAP